VAGLSGGSGKTLVSLALLLEAKRRGLPVRAFKKGPDYIDAQWLGWAAGASARNLDSWLMGFEEAAASLARHGLAGGLNLIEGNRGLYDGLDARGSHSTAELAKAVRAPVVLVVNATKVTRTAAAFVVGCQKLDPEVRIAGVILNHVVGRRHEQVLREAIESACGVPVLGALPRISGDPLVPMRHLGLVTPDDFRREDRLAEELRENFGGCLDFERLFEIARGAPPLPGPPGKAVPRAYGAGLRIGFLRDAAFSFYYPENLEALEAVGAELCPLPALTCPALPPDLNALYIGGGFPETHARTLAENRSLLASVREAARRGLPVYAECGGLMYLSDALHWKGERHAMAGVLPFEVDVRETPQGHGYAELVVDTPNPFFPPGTRLKGHEFHYSRVMPAAGRVSTACAVVRGTGCLDGRDAVLVDNVWAAYTHLHALGTPEWTDAMLHAARSASPVAV
jgi:cobyrinic acid a,c-diamide synthase